MIADSFRLNGGVLRMEKSTTVLQVAHNSLVNIATHSFLEGLSIAGSYRLCNVDIQGQSQSVLSGSTIMQNGRVVDTDRERLRIQRRFVFNMLSAQGHHVCVVCVSNGHGALQTLAEAFDTTPLDFPNRQSAYDLDLSSHRTRLFTIGRHVFGFVKYFSAMIHMAVNHLVETVRTQFREMNEEIQYV